VIYLGLGVFAPGGLGPVVAEYGALMFILGNALRIVGCICGAMAVRR
jgi:hypothetical protein